MKTLIDDKMWDGYQALLEHMGREMAGYTATKEVPELN